MAKFSVGEKVTARKDMNVGHWYSGERQLEDRDVTPDMCKYKGQEVTISEVYEDNPYSDVFYHIKEDKAEYAWTFDMFE